MNLFHNFCYNLIYVFKDDTYNVLSLVFLVFYSDNLPAKSESDYMIRPSVYSLDVNIIKRIMSHRLIRVKANTQGNSVWLSIESQI